MIEPKKWKIGYADEFWKVVICARDYNDVDDLACRLVGILTDEIIIDKGLDKIRTMTGNQIVDALFSYQDSCLKSVEKALKKGEIS